MSAVEFTEEQLATNVADRTCIGVRPASPWQMLHIIANAYGVDADDIRGPSRLKPVTAARFALYLELRAVGWSYPAIGRFVNRDHTSVMAGVKKAHERSAAKARVA